MSGLEETGRWFIEAGTDRDRLGGRLEITRCPLCACLIIVADEDDHVRWHVSLVA